MKAIPTQTQSTPMNKQAALELLDRLLAQVSMTRRDHQMVEAALVYLDRATVETKDLHKGAADGTTAAPDSE